MVAQEQIEYQQKEGTNLGDLSFVINTGETCSDNPVLSKISPKTRLTPILIIVSQYKQLSGLIGC